MRIIRKCVIVAAAISLAGCELNLQNPNAPTEGQVTTNVDGVIALATGLQGRFATSYGNFAYMASSRTSLLRPRRRSFPSVTRNKAQCPRAPASRITFSIRFIGRFEPQTTC